MGAFFIYSSSDKKLDTSQIKKIGESLIFFSWVKYDTYEDSGLQIIYSLFKKNKLRIKKTENLIFILDGDIYESIEGPDAEDSFGNIIIKYHAKGIDNCAGLNGIYNFIVYNSQSKTFETANDKFGLFQIFHCAINDKECAITSTISTLNFIPNFKKEIDQRAIFELCYLGTAFRERSVLKNVTRLLQNSTYQIKNSTLSLIKTHTYAFPKQKRDYSIPDLLDELDFFYSRAVKRSLSPQKKIAFLISGGKDSRVQSYFLKKNNIIPHGFTFGESHFGETYLARAVCKELGFSWQRIGLTQDSTNQFAENSLDLDSYSCRLFAPYMFEVLNTIGPHWDCTLSAFKGDPVFGSYLSKIKLNKNDTLDSAFEKMLHYLKIGMLSKEDLENLFPGKAQEYAHDLEKELYDSLEKCGEELYQKVSMGLFLSGDTRFKVGGILRLMSCANTVKLPVIDNDLINFTYSLPICMYYDRTLLDIFLARKSPGLASIPMDKNSSEYHALTRSFKKDIKFKIWLAGVEKFKIPMLKAINPTIATTQSYIQVFSMHNQGFIKLTKRAHDYLPSCDGVINIEAARQILNRSFPKGLNHINSGSYLRSILSTILACKNFT